MTRHNESTTARWEPASWKMLVFVITAAICIRGGVLWLMPRGLNVDTDGYRRIAVTVRQSGMIGVPVTNDTPAATSPPSSFRATAHRPPLYPLVLAGLVTDGTLAPWAVGGLHLILGVLTVFMVYRLGIAWELGNWSVLAALFTACDPILLHQSVQIMTETIAAFFVILSLWGLTWIWTARYRSTSSLKRSQQIEGPNPPLRIGRGRDIGCGLLVGATMGLACICRPTFLPWCVCLAAGSIIFSSRFALGRTTAVSLALGTLMVLMPWGVRNYLQMGSFTFSTTHGGYTLLLGNNPSFYAHLRSTSGGAVWDARELKRDWRRSSTLPTSSEGAIHLEVAEDEAAYALARRYIREDPAMFARASVTRIVWLWHILPKRLEQNEPETVFLLRAATAAWYIGLYGLVVVAVVFRRQDLGQAPWVWGLLLCFTTTAVHTLYWSNMRMRAPLMPFICLIAAAGAAEMGQAIRRRAAAR